MGSFKCEMLTCGTIESRWWQNCLHSHSFFEACYIFRGKGAFRVGEQDFPLGEGNLFLSKPGEVHEIVPSWKKPLGLYYWSYTLVRVKDSEAGASGVDGLLAAFLESRKWVSGDVSGMQRTLDLLTEEISGRKPGYLPAVEGLLTKLLLDSARAMVDGQSVSVPAEAPARTSSEASVQRAIRFLRDNRGRAISVGDVADQVHMSERHINRLFHKATKKTILEYLTGLRMESATQLLLDQRLSIKEIAYTCGYPDAHYFSVIFRRHVGMTPTDFRAKGGTKFEKKK